MSKSKKKEMDTTPLDRQAADYKRLTEEIRGYMRKWIPILGLSLWHIDTEYCSQFHEHHKTADACCHPNWEYEQAMISFYLPSIAESSCSLQETVVHELCHCVMGPITKSDPSPEEREHMELTVTRISRAFIRFDNLVHEKPRSGN